MVNWYDKKKKTEIHDLRLHFDAILMLSFTCKELYLVYHYLGVLICLDSVSMYHLQVRSCI